MKCPQCNGPVPADALTCPRCKVKVAVDRSPTDSSNPPGQTDNPFRATPIKAAGPSAPVTTEGDATGGVIPYKNPQALIAYYLGILSGLPLIGFPLGIAAFILGIRGLRARKENPIIKGSIHAGIGIGCGSIFTLLWGFALFAMIYAWLAEQ